MIKSTVRANGIIIFILLCGIYIVPEKTKVFCILAFAMLMIHLWFNRYLILINKNQLVLWGIFVLFGTGMSLANRLNLNTALEFAVTLVMGALLGNVYMREEVRQSVIQAVVMVTIVTLIGCILQFATPNLLSLITNMTLGANKYYYFKDFISYGALVGFSYQTGVTGYYLALLAGFVFCIYLNIDRKKMVYRLLALILFSGVYLLILLTRKRSQLLAVLVLAIVLYAIYNRKNALKIIVISGVLLIGAILMLEYTTVGQSIINRSIGAGASLSGRERIYSILIDNFKRNPLFGNGFGYTLRSVQNYRNGHNVYLQVLSENGIIGLSLYLVIIISYLKQAYKVLKYVDGKSRSSRNCTFCLYIEGLFVLNGMFGNPLYDVFPVIVFMLASGVINSQLRDAEYCYRKG